MSDGYGSGDYTPLKVEHYRDLIHLHLELVRVILARQHWMSQRYYYFDVTAGPGLHPADGSLQAPLIFRQEVEWVELPRQAFFIERDPATFVQLRRHFEGASGWQSASDGFECINADLNPALLECMARCMPRSKGDYLGLVYYDPKPGKEVFEAMRFLAEVSRRPNMERIDFLFYVSATDVKRMREWGQTLDQTLAPFAKKHWLIRKPFGAHQWTFILGTNWADFPAYKRIDFHRKDSDQGRTLFDRINLTAGERKQRGPSLFDGQP